MIDYEVHRIDYAFGHWLAGFVDGEGCFRIHKAKRTTGDTFYSCAFTLKLRDDDRPILDEICVTTNLGSVRAVRPDGNARPLAQWVVQNQIDCLALTQLFDVFPLRAKKARDFEIWKLAVCEWCDDHGKRRDWSRMAELHDDLQLVRQYLVTA